MRTQSNRSKFKCASFLAVIFVIIATVQLPSPIQAQSPNDAVLEVASSAGGGAVDLIVDGHRVFLLQPGSVVAFDLSDESNWVYKSRYTFEGQGSRIELFDNTLFIMTWKSVQIVDVSDLSHFHPLSEIPGATNVFKVDGGYLMNISQGPAPSTSTICFVELGDPSHPVVTSLSGTTGGVFATKGSHAYVKSQTAGVYLVDLASDSLVHVGAFPGQLFNKYERFGDKGQYLLGTYGFGNGNQQYFQSWDLTIPASPVLLGDQQVVPQSCYYEYIRGNFAMGTRGNQLVGLFGDVQSPTVVQEMRFYDLSDPTSGTLLAAYPLRGIPLWADQVLGLSDDRIAWAYDTDPGSLHFGVVDTTTKIKEYKEVYDFNIGGPHIVPSGHYGGYVLSGTAGKLAFCTGWPGAADITDPFNPFNRRVECSKLHPFPTDPDAAGPFDTIHVADGNLAIRILGEDHPTNPIYELRAFEVFEVVGNEEPALRARVDMDFPFAAKWMAPVLQDGRLLVFGEHGGSLPFPQEYEYRIYDLRNLDDIRYGVMPPMVDFRYDLHGAAVAEDRLYTKLYDYSTSSTRIGLWDISDIELPAYVQTLDPPLGMDQLTSVEAAWGDCIISYSRINSPRGYYIVNFGDVDHPVLMGTFIPGIARFVPESFMSGYTFKFPYLITGSTRLEFVDVTASDLSLPVVQETEEYSRKRVQMFYCDGVLCSLTQAGTLDFTVFYRTAESKSQIEYMLDRPVAPESVTDWNEDAVHDVADVLKHFRLALAP